MNTKICFKCGKTEGQMVLIRGIFKPTRIISHHIKYEPEILVDCCDSCHKKIHVRARKNNTCRYSIEDIQKMTIKSSIKRTTKNITFYTQLAPDVRLLERIVYNINTGNVCCISSFFANHGAHLYIEDI